MDPILSIFGAVLVAIVSTFVGPWLLERARRGRVVEYRYRCVWAVTTPEMEEQEFADRLTLKIDQRGRVTGYGDADLGRYDIAGRASRFCIALNFSGVRDRSDLAGVVFLRRTPGMETMTGFWTQLRKDGRIMDGTVSLNLLTTDIESAQA